MPDPTGSFGEFWIFYLRAHSDARTRLAHFIGTSAGLVLLAAALVLLDWRLLIAAPIVGYAAAWFGHFAFEGNKPATFGHPLWSFASDFRMLFLWLAGRLEPELRRAGIEEG